MGALKPWHIFVLVAVLVLLFGAKRLPGAARSLGQSMRIMKAETRGLREDEEAATGTAAERVLEGTLNPTTLDEPGRQRDEAR